MTGYSPRNWSENIARMSLLLSLRAALWPLAFALLACAGTVQAEPGGFSSTGDIRAGTDQPNRRSPDCYGQKLRPRADGADFDRRWR